MTSEVRKKGEIKMSQEPRKRVSNTEGVLLGGQEVK